MNKSQKKVVYAAVVLFTLTILFPPWLYENSMTSGEYSAGYHFVLIPPEVKSDAEMRKQFLIPEDEMHEQLSFIVKLNFYRFIFQIIAIVFLVIIVLLITSKKKTI